MVNKYTVDYHPRPSELTSRMYPVIFFLDSYGVYLSRIFLEFVLKVVNPTMVAESRPLHFFWNRTLTVMLSWKFAFVSFSKHPTFLWYRHSQNLVGGPDPEFYGVKITGRYIYKLKKLIPPSRKEVTHFTWAAFSESYFSPSKKKGLWSWKNEQN